MLQRVAVCCSVLQCVAVCCGVYLALAMESSHIQGSHRKIMIREVQCIVLQSLA